ncbi:MAG: flagellar biosynthetic protein FliR [Candidatus Binatia bacterium]|nr:flagellar biosynthetic protein FliR [Candidatus Binatia bacterium]
MDNNGMSVLAQFITAHWTTVVIFVLVLARTGGVIVSAPFWGGRMVPGLVRFVVAVVVSVAVYPLATRTLAETARDSFRLDEDLSLFVLLVALGAESLLGLGLGWVAQFLFTGMRVAGQVVEIRMGLGLSQLLDPQDGGQTTTLSTLFELVAVLVFFSLNGHLLLIQALAASYQLFPLSLERVRPALSGLPVATETVPTLARPSVVAFLAGVVSSAGTIFAIALRISAPVVVGLLLSDLLLGIMSRTIPQMNIFVVSLPLQLALGLVVLFFSLPALVWFCTAQFSLLNEHLSAFPRGGGR